MPISAAILAAGTSSRLGRAKQFLELDGETLIHRVARLLLETPIERVIVVVNTSHVLSMKTELRDLNVEIVANAQSREGMASSVRTAVKVAEKSVWDVAGVAEKDALLLTPCDLPLLSASHLRALIEQYQREGAPIVASRYNETLGAPLIIARELWPELLQLRGDVGARRVITKHKASWVEWPQGAIDVDTRADWEDLGYEF